MPAVNTLPAHKTIASLPGRTAVGNNPMNAVYKKLAVFLLLLFCAVCTACNRHRQPVTRAFYYWKTVYRPAASEVTMLQQLHCLRIYLRCFDIDWNEQSHMLLPVSIIRLPAYMDTTMNYVPVFYLTQKALAHCTAGTNDSLAANIDKLVTQLCSNAHIAPKEIQADCDWTATNKEVYFSLLTALKSQPFFEGKTLSCTIRMHQVKYRSRNGVPPAEKGLLMCYNMGDLKKYGDHNSILDIAEARKYLDNLDTYPLKMDVALPLFHWCLLFRKQRFAGILRDVAPEQIAADTDFEQVKNNLYRCKKDINKYGYSFRGNDILRLETFSYNDVSEMAAFVESKMKKRPENICLFHCDSLTISRYAPQQLEKIYTAFD
jgi:hypothetical protein